MNQKLDLNFIQKLPFSILSVSWLGIGVLLTSFALSIFTWQTYQSKQAINSAIESKLINLEKQAGHENMPVQIVSADISEEKKQQINSIVSSLTTPWEALLLSIETSDMQDIALLSFEPNIKKQQVALTGEAKNLESVLAYIQRLEAQPMLAKVYLQKHNVSEAEPSKPVRFTLLAEWDNGRQYPTLISSQGNEKAKINE